MGKKTWALAALGLLLLLAPQTSAQDEDGDGDDLTGGIIIFPPANVPKELEGVPPVPQAVDDAIDTMVPGAGDFFGHLFDTPECPDTGCTPPLPAPPPVWLQPISPPYVADTSAPLTGGLGDLVNDVTNETKTDSDGSDLDGFLGFRVYSVSVGSRNNIAGFGGVFVLMVMAAVAYSTKQRRASKANPSQEATSTYGSIEISTPRVEYQKVSTTSDDHELPL